MQHLINSSPLSNSVWSIILSGGEGERLRPFIERWLGYHLPKQYCTFVGSRSMLQHTWARADRVTAPDQKVTVVARHHQQEALSQAALSLAGQIILQPQNCDTSAGIFLPLTYIRAQNPQATVVVYPADHFVFPEDRFAMTIRQAIQATHALPEKIVLLGVRPTCLELEYGWIEPSGPHWWSRDLRVKRVHAFLEKPDRMQGLTAFANGAFWNTFIMVAKVETLWKAGWKYIPDVMEGFEKLGAVIGTPQEGATLDAIYCNMPRRNFSSDLLACAPESVGMIELKDVIWNDWGRPERIVETLRVLGKEPAFPTGHFPTFDSGQYSHKGLMNVG